MPDRAAKTMTVTRAHCAAAVSIGVGADGGREWINAYSRPKAVYVSLL